MEYSLKEKESLRQPNHHIPQPLPEPTTKKQASISKKDDLYDIDSLLDSLDMDDKKPKTSESKLDSYVPIEQIEKVTTSATEPTNIKTAQAGEVTKSDKGKAFDLPIATKAEPPPKIENLRPISNPSHVTSDPKSNDLSPLIVPLRPANESHYPTSPKNTSPTSLIPIPSPKNAKSSLLPPSGDIKSSEGSKSSPITIKPPNDIKSLEVSKDSRINTNGIKSPEASQEKLHSEAIKENRSKNVQLQTLIPLSTSGTQLKKQSHVTNIGSEISDDISNDFEEDFDIQDLEDEDEEFAKIGVKTILRTEPKPNISVSSAAIGSTPTAVTNSQIMPKTAEEQSSLKKTDSIQSSSKGSNASLTKVETPKTVAERKSQETESEPSLFDLVQKSSPLFSSLKDSMMKTPTLDSSSKSMLGDLPSLGTNSSKPSFLSDLPFLAPPQPILETKAKCKDLNAKESNYGYDDDFGAGHTDDEIVFSDDGLSLSSDNEDDKF